jgi:glyoxylase-like metal-dependent hydrolase (beta-lactamase superfamily II)
VHARDLGGTELMHKLADDLYQLAGFPPNFLNTYLMGGVLVDAATRFDAGWILRQLKGHAVTAHVLTHATPTTRGASKRVCDERAIPFWCGKADVAAAEADDMAVLQSNSTTLRWMQRLIGGPGLRVDRALGEGDDAGGFTVLEVPGHSPGHVAFWREHDRTLLLGDVLFNQHPWRRTPGLQPPRDEWTPDPALNRASARRLGELGPRLVCFGHGPPLSDTRAFVEFCSGLPA